MASGNVASSEGLRQARRVQPSRAHRKPCPLGDALTTSEPAVAYGEATAPAG